MNKFHAAFLATAIGVAGCSNLGGCAAITTESVEGKSRELFLNARVIFAKADAGSITLRECQDAQKKQPLSGELSHKYGEAIARSASSGASAPSVEDMERVVNFNGDAAHFISETLKICTGKFGPNFLR